jgi:hypothetical protein
VGLTLLLGAQLWAVVVGVPALYGPATTASRFICPLPLVLLGFATRNPRDSLLFGAFPATLALCAGFQPEACAMLVPTPVLAFAGLALIAYLLSAARAATQAEAPARVKQRPTTPATPAPRPTRQIVAILRVYCVVAPLCLLASVLEPSAQAAVAAAYPDHPSAPVLLICLATAGWAGVAFIYLAAPLAGAYTAQSTSAELRETAAELRHARPGAMFYLAVVCALLAMAVLAILRYR